LEWILVRGAEMSTMAVKLLKGLHMTVSATLQVCCIAGDTGGEEVGGSISGQVMSYGIYAKDSFGTVSCERGDAQGPKKLLPLNVKSSKSDTTCPHWGGRRVISMI
jgi:hypothetical protein